VSEKTELKILEWVTSPGAREREKGVELFIKTYENKAKSWIIKKGLKDFVEDIWMEAAHLMIRAIQAGAYQKMPGVELYTYFHKILSGVHSKYYNRERKNKQNVEIDVTDESLKEINTPESYLQLVELLAALEYCLLQLKPDERELLKDKILKGKKLIDLVEKYNLKTYNNAKQKYFKLKKMLLNCLNTREI